MLDDKGYSRHRTNILTDAKIAARRSQDILISLVLLHKQLDGGGKPAAATVEKLLARVSSESGIKLKPQRSRVLPMACIDESAAADAISLLLRALNEPIGRKSITTRYRQKGDELVVHLGLPKARREHTSLLKALSVVPAERYPLVAGEHTLLAAAYVVLRKSGIRMVIRPRKLGSLDIYLHIPVMQQLTLVDITPDLG
jgi:hypothetical protein